mgnify:CR=1 FL=1
MREPLAEVLAADGEDLDVVREPDELRVIAATVIGGANLMGGQGSVYGAVIGAALIFLIRNSLIMFGVDANWYDLFVGLFIIFAVLLERIRARTSG